MNNIHNEEKYKYKDLTRRIIGCAMRVHNQLGNGFQEVIYQRCLAIEFENNGISYAREKEMTIYYNDTEVGNRRVDFLVEGIILVELKATSQIEEVNKAQIINYLEACNLEIGLLINFGTKRLEFKRFIKTK
uniref:GxxExxY protein n=1 Tax=candidate division CPR3 bacterium TaxID=2268181 RepID=A0A7C4M0R7_UNCC3